MFRRTVGAIFQLARPVLMNRSKNFASVVPAVITLAHCSIESKNDPIKLGSGCLDHEFLIQQATTVNVNAATQLLTVTMVAIHQTSEKLRQYLAEEINLYKQAQELGIATINPSHWDSLISLRIAIEDLKYNLVTLFSYMEYAEKIGTTAAEISFLSGNTAASDAICQRIHHSNNECAQQKALNSALMRECLQLQRQVIEASPDLEQLFETPTTTGKDKK